jgi:hypothetical protein
MSNFAILLATVGKLTEADQLAREAWQLSGLESSQLTSEIAFTRWLLDRTAGKPGESALGRLKTIFANDFERILVGSFDDFITAMRDRLPEAERNLATKLVDAMSNKAKVVDLDSEPIWQAVAPLPLDVTWPE